MLLLRCCIIFCLVRRWRWPLINYRARHDRKLRGRMLLGFRALGTRGSLSVQKWLLLTTRLAPSLLKVTFVKGFLVWGWCCWKSEVHQVQTIGTPGNIVWRGKQFGLILFDFIKFSLDLIILKKTIWIYLIYTRRKTNLKLCIISTLISTSINVRTPATFYQYWT